MTDPGHDQPASGQPGPDQRGPDQRSPDQPGDDGAEPDPRFTFANERTFLAWSRTALALVVAGLGVVQLLPPFPGVPWGREALGVPLIVFGAIVAITAYGEWTASQRAMRHGQPLPRSVMPMIMTVVIAAMAVLAAIVVLSSALR
jgi:putative membrane protein